LEIRLIARVSAIHNHKYNTTRRMADTTVGKQLRW
jgi:hypothetical protein